MSLVGREREWVTLGEKIHSFLEATSEGGLGTLKLPYDLVDILNEGKQALVELESEGTRWARWIPWGASKRRVNQLQAQVVGATKIIDAIRQGFDPYTIPSSFFVGALDRKDKLQAGFFGIGDPNKSGKLGLYFNQLAMPPEVEERHKAAKKTKLFESFVVASPERHHFRPVEVLGDPVLVGFVRTGSVLRFHQTMVQRTNPNDFYQWEILRGVEVEGGVGFLIAQWGLVQDFKAGGII